jgi:hypothetical protein
VLGAVNDDGRSVAERIAGRVLRLALEADPRELALLLSWLAPPNQRVELEATAKSFEGPYLEPFTSTEEARASKESTHGGVYRAPPTTRPGRGITETCGLSGRRPNATG